MNNPAPITDAALERVKSAYAALPEGPWCFSVSKSGRRQIHNGKQPVCAMWNTATHPGHEIGPAMVDIHNSLPALFSRLARAEADRAAIRAEVLREAAELLEETDTATGALMGLRIREMAAAEEEKAK